MKGKSALLVSVAGVLVAAEVCVAAAQPGAVGGIAFDARTRRPLANVRVEMLETPAVTLTDSDGRFVLEELSAGPHVLRAVAEGYTVLAQSIEIRPASVANVELWLLPTVLRLNEAVVVTARREEVSAFEAPRSTTVVTSADLAERLPRTTPEALMESTGVWVQKTNHGGGSPFVRGLVGNQVLVLVDGVRLNNSTFRLGPNQYLATVDPGQIDRIEVVRGSGSVLHGSDALGGVINIITRRPQFSSGRASWHGAATAKYLGAGMEQSGRLEVEGRAARGALIGGLSLRNFGDLRAGGSLGVESPSGYQEIDGDLKALVRLSPNGLLTMAYQHVHQSDVPRFDQVAQRGFARYAFDPQVRRLGYARLQMFSRSRWLRTFTATASLHQSSERRIRQPRGSPVQIVEQDDVRVRGLSAEAKSVLSANWSLLSGVEYYDDAIGSWRRDDDTAAGTSLTRRGLYPDRASATSVAAFSHSSGTIGRLTVELGGRYSRYGVRAQDTRFGRIEIHPESLVGNAAAAYALRGSLRLFGSVAQAFRAPNVDDLSTLGAFDFGIEVPAGELAPERAISYEAGLKARAGSVSGSVAAFRTNLRDLIDRVPGSFEGSELLEGQRVYHRANVARAYIQGFEGEMEWHPAAGLAVFGNLTYTYGHQTTTDQPVRRIPPLNGLVGARWEREAFSTEAIVRFAGTQDRLAAGDREDHRIAPGGTPGWQVLDLRVRYDVSGKVDLAGGVQNAFDEAYRVHGSGIDGYGRSAWAGATFRF